MLKDQVLDKGIEDAFINKLFSELDKGIIKINNLAGYSGYQFGGIYIHETGLVDSSGFKFRLSPESWDKVFSEIERQFALQQIKKDKENAEAFADFIGLPKEVRHLLNNKKD